MSDENDDEEPDRFDPPPDTVIWRHPWQVLPSEKIKQHGLRKLSGELSILIRFAYGVDRFHDKEEKLCEEVIVEAIGFRFLRGQQLLLEMALEAEPLDLRPWLVVFRGWRPEQIMVSPELDHLVIRYIALVLGFVGPFHDTADKAPHWEMGLEVLFMAGKDDQISLLNAQDATPQELLPFVRAKY